jgi:uncharacterized protein (TIGR02391 family)
MNQDKEEKLKMTFDPNTIQHLGIKMYSNLPAALAELVANAYDADATEVHIKLFDNDEMKRITVSDDGTGMSFVEINDYFLKIGRNRRSENLKQTLGGRVASGKKGLGKLALFGIGERIDVTTKKIIENRTTHFVLQWDTLKNWNKITQGPDYEPTFDFIDQNDNKQGTEICISDLKRKTDFSSIDDLAANLAKMFNFLDENFKIYISRNDQSPIEITNKLKYESLDIQFTWDFPSTSIRTVGEYEEKANLSGQIITTKTPLRPGQRGVTLFANGRMVNSLEFFGVSESSHFFSYTTGWLNVDFIDEDDGDDDNISTNRQSLDWEKEKSIKLKNFLQGVLSLIQKEWREKRKEENKKDAEGATGINVEKWLSTIPADKAEIISKTIEDVSNPDFKANYTEIVEKALHQIAPEYAELHWRYLHRKITSNQEINRLYTQKNYFQAASECAKLYIEEVRSLSKSTNGSDSSMMGEVFGRENNKIISLTERKDEVDGDVEEGQKYYSMGIVTGFKNPVCSHATETSLKSRGLFNEKDCLDIFSLLSHLFYRLDNVKKK